MSLVLQIAIVCQPPVQTLFKTTPLPAPEWALVLGLALRSTVWYEGVKLIAAWQQQSTAASH